MKIFATQWIIIIFTISIIIIAAKSDDIDYSGVISIDCGVNESYNDPANNIRYQADDNEVVQFGEIQNFDSGYPFSNQIQKQLMSLRSFPYGKRNCYTMKPKQGKNQKYIMRAYFAYWNYDNKNKLPIFDLYLGVNYFGTVDLDTVDSVQRFEAIHVSSTDTIELCLVNTEKGIPFISLLELWHLGSTNLYGTSDDLLPLFLNRRTNLGMSESNEEFKRYMDDIYGRSWFEEKDLGLGSDAYQMTTSSVVIDLQKIDNPYELPLDVLTSAVEALNVSTSLSYTDNLVGDYEYYVYLHFFDFSSENNDRRIMEITLSGPGDEVTKLLDLKSLTPITIFMNVKEGMGIDSILIEATPESDLPAMLNAFEIYSVVSQPNYATQEDDVDATRNIRDIYNISRIDWQGDPCGPTNFTWEGVTCRGDNNPGIISLNLSSSNLSGGIDVAFSKLKHLEILDLSNNELTGVVPMFLGELPKLRILNLSSNNLTGSIPESLKDKSNLQLSLDGNQGLCLTCIIKRHKSNVWLVASITVPIAVLFIVAIVVTMIWRRIKSRKVKGLVMISSSSKKIEQLNNKSRTFKHSEVVSITNDFETMIGEGGFGKVYLGTLEGGEKVAVKTLSLSASQGHKQFISEANLLMTVHHRHVVTLVGYCDEGDTRALIYEYLPGGNLHQRLSGKNPNILEWNERLQIALDVASGLDYLHNGCPLAIIHRDLKPSNILLHENMRAKISDFGLSRAFINDNDTHVLTEYLAGTQGYVGPECQNSGILNKKSDVYSFGVILLELITGQKAKIDTADDDKIHILPWVNLKLKTGGIQAIVDPRLQGKYTNTSAWRFTEIAMSCLRQLAAQRPDIKDIVSELKDLSQEILSLERNVSNNINSSVGDSMGIELSELDSGPVPR